jgi:membrane-bound ClpP family serine protease
MDILIVVVLCAVGITLLLLEVFLIPGITIAALGGVLAEIGAVYYAYTHLGILGGTITLFASLLVFGFALVYFVKSKTLDSIALKTDIPSTVASGDALKIKEGDTGIAISRLNPMGRVKVNDVMMEAKTVGEFIDEATAIKVIKVAPTQLIVETNRLI